MSLGSTSVPRPVRDRWANAAMAILAGAAGLWGLAMLIAVRKTFPAVVFPVYSLGILLVVTALTRSLPLRWVAGLALLGATTVPMAILLSCLPFSRWLGTDSHIFRWGVVPLVEEALKVAPLLILLVSRRWRYRATVGASDLLLLGAALGAGVAFYEDALRGWIPGFSANAILEVHRASPHRGLLYLFPHMSVQASVGTASAAFIGHAGAAALMGLTLGLARLLRGRLGRVPSWILPLVAWGWSVFDHAVYNVVSGVSTGQVPGSSELPRLLDLLWRIDLRGRLSSIVFYALILAALLLERGILRRAREYIAGLDLSRRRLVLLRGQFAHPAGRIAHLLGLGIYLRERRGLVYGHYYYAQGYEQDRALGTYLVHLEAVLRRHKRALELPPDQAVAQGSGPGE